MKRIIAAFICLGALSTVLVAQPGSDIIRNAMKDELSRNIERLKLENLKSPFFISYEVRDLHRTHISASLGSLLLSKQQHSRDHSPRVMVGNYQRNDENFMDMGSGFSFSMSGFSRGSDFPLENDYDGIRRALWLDTDDLYRSAADTYEKKIAAIEQQNLQEEIATLPDFSKEEPKQYHVDPINFTFDDKKWENYARDISAVFLDFPEIQSSRAHLTFVNLMVYMVNSEGTDISYPITLAALQLYANMQADDGEILNEQVAFYARTPEQLPSKNDIVEAAKELGKTLILLSSAKKFEDTYTGPVMFEGQAVGELISQRLFLQKDGLIATRDQISSTPGAAAFLGSNKSLEDRIGKRIMPKDISIVAKSQLMEYNGIPLIGAYEIDREGVVPQKELALVTRGKLMTLLNDRVPSRKVRQSNGHDRLGINKEAGIAPGVIHLSSSNTMEIGEMREELLETAKDEGLSYAIIVRKIASPTIAFEEDMNPEDLFSMQMSGGKSEGKIQAPIRIYKVDVESGEETLLRAAKFSGIPVSSLRDIVACEDKEYVYNTLTNPNSGGRMGLILRFASSKGSSAGGFPSTFIVPNAILFSELELKKSGKTATPKLPIVSSPLIKK